MSDDETEASVTDAQRILAESYLEGEFSDLAKSVSSAAFVAAAREVGDTLFAFLAIELSAKEMGGDLRDAPATLETAIRDVEGVLDAVRASLATAAAP